MNKQHQFNIFYFLIVFTLVVAFQAWLGYRQVAQLAYSDFREFLEQRQIAEVVVTNDRIQGRFATPQDGKEYFVANRVEPGFAAELEKYGVKFSGRNRWQLVHDPSVVGGPGPVVFQPVDVRVPANG